MANESYEVEIEVNLAVRLSREDINDIMCTAFEGGITGWCGSAPVVGKRLGKYAHEQIARGGTLRLHDIESSDTWDLDLTKFLAGFKRFIESCYFYCPIDKGRIDTSNIDGEAADAIIQYAVFGELLFG